MMVIGFVELYHGDSGKKGFYNCQEIGLARAMRKLGYTCVVFYPRTEIYTVEEETVENGIRVVYVPAHALGSHSWYDLSILKTYKIEVVQLSSDNQLFAPMVVRYCDRNDIPCYHFVGAVGSDSSSAVKRKIMAFLFRRNLRVFRTHQVFAKTAFVQAELMKLGVSNVRIAHVGLDTSVISEIDMDREAVRRTLGYPTDQKLILFVGRIDEYKRPFELITLAESLPEEYRFIVIGSGRLNPEFEIAIRPFGGRIQWIHQLPNAEIHGFYKAADYLVNFNQKEIFGMSILEAMYQGCTVIANHAPGPDEIIEHGVSGYLVDSTEQMRNLILEDKKLDPNVIREYLLSHFTWERTAKCIQTWIQQQNADTK